MPASSGYRAAMPVLPVGSGAAWVTAISTSPTITHSASAVRGPRLIPHAHDQKCRVTLQIRCAWLVEMDTSPEELTVRATM